jgi:TP901 family phage tail tape measure protein
MSEAIKKSDIVQGDPFGEIAADITETLAALDKYDKSIKSIANTMQNNLSKAAKKTVQDIEAINKAEIESEKLVQAKIRTSKLQLDLQAKQNQLNAQTEKQAEQQARALEREAAQKEKANKQSERAAKLAKDEASAYKQLERNTRELKNQSKELGAQMLKLEQSGKRNTAEYRKLESQYKSVTKAAQAGDVQLKKLDKTVGDNFRNVGNYQSAIGGLKNVLGNLGIAFGASTVIQGAVTTIREFDQAIADLVSITGAGGKDLEFFKEQAIGLGKEVQGGASAVIEAYKLIGSAKPELLQNAEALNEVTKSAITLSQASGMELPAAATALTDAMNQFGAPAEQAGKFINVLANGALFGAAEIPQVTEALLRFGAVAKTANVSVEESTALIEALAEKGLKGADAGTALRNVMLKLSAPDALPRDAKRRLDELGISFATLEDTSQPFSTRLEALKPLLNDNAALVKVFGTENAVAATNLIRNSGRVAELTKQMETQGTATKQAEDRTKTLSQSFIELQGSFEGYLLQLNEASGAGATFANAIQFLAQNLTTILNTVAKVGRAWLLYRAGLLAANAAQFLFNGGLKDTLQGFLKSIPSTRAYRLEQIKLARATTASGEAVKSTGRALSAVPWMAIIGVVIELATAFYDVASGAAEARRQQEITDNYTANAAKKADKRVSERSANLEKEIAALQRQRNENKISEQEFLKLKEAAIKKSKEQVSGDIKAVNQRKANYKNALADLKGLQKEFEKTNDPSKLIKKTGEIAKKYGLEGDESWVSFFTGDKDAATTTQVIQNLEASIAATNTKLKTYNEELSGIGETTKDATSEVEAYDVQQVRSGNITKANTASVKEYKTEFKDLNEYISEQTDLLQKLQEIQQERTLDGQQQNIDDMLANQVKAARETGEAQVDQLEATIAAMFQLEKDYIEQKRDFQLQQIEADYQLNKAKRLQELNDEKADLIAAADGNADAIAKININYDAKKKQLDTDEALRYEDLQLQKTIVTEEATDEVTDLKQQEHDEINRVNDAIIEGQKEFSAEVNNVNKEGSDKDVDTIKERYDLIQGIQQAATDALKEQIDKRIDLLQQEADAAKTQQDFLQNLAANGNIYAQQSIAEQIRIQRDAQQEQLRLERQKQSIELISAGLKTFEASLSEGKTPAQALAATVVSTQVLTGFLKNLQFFEKGTMNAPGGLSVVDEKGAELITDRRGNIKEMGAGKGARFTMLSPGDKVYTASQTSSLLSSFDSVGNMSKIPKALSASGGFETATITRELKALQQIVSDKSESNVHWESFSSGISEIVQNKNVSGRKITNRFRVK